MNDTSHLVGIEWEPWFTPLNNFYQVTEAIPLIGQYDSFNDDVITQHAIWMVQAGIDYIMVDWTNNLWGLNHWDQRPPGAWQLCNATTKTVEVYQRLLDSKVFKQIPKVVMLLGLSNGPTTTMTAINEEIKWIAQNYVHNKTFSPDMWVWYQGKPLLLVFDGNNLHSTSKIPVDDSVFTIRWMSTQLQANHFDRLGFWSWMDGSLTPITTYISNGIAEAVTPTIAFFPASGGWLAPQAYSRLDGFTFIQEMKTSAFKTKPIFTLINQWNEFLGAPNGSTIYVDCYNIPLSNDIEPTSMTECGYRDCGGWGFYYLNLMRALITMYHQQNVVNSTVDWTIIAVRSPLRDQKVNTTKLIMEWAIVGQLPNEFHIFVDDKLMVKTSAGSTRATIDLNGFKNGAWHSVKLVAEGTKTPFKLAYEHVDVPAVPMITPVVVKQIFLAF